MQALLPTREVLPRVQLLILIVYHPKTVRGASLSSWKKLQMQGLLLTREILTHVQLIIRQFGNRAGHTWGTAWGTYIKAL